MNIAKFSLEAKVAPLTGGSRGIGRAIALAFADAGADVLASSRKLSALEEVAEEIRAKCMEGLVVTNFFPLETHGRIENGNMCFRTGPNCLT